jgi:flavin reductase
MAGIFSHHPAVASAAPLRAVEPRGAVSAVDPASYRQGMRRLASGVTVITTAHEGGRFGLVSTGVASVSAEPPMLLVCVNQAASSHDPIVRSGHFCVNVLREDDQELAARFSSPQHRATRFVGREWRVLATGAPALAGCLASFDCLVERALAAGTHTVFFGQVAEVRCWTPDVDPLLYWDGAYRAAVTPR